METNISNEIILSIFDSDSHARSLARKLNTNHMTIINKLRELINANIVDFKQMKMYPRLRKIIEDILKNPKIKLAILFGSYAKGLAHEDSDIDVFVETKSRILKRNLENIDSRLSIKIGTFNRLNPLIREIEKNHIIIKGIEIYHEKTKSF
jgi:predicted nucleotidyltransferase